MSDAYAAGVMDADGSIGIFAQDGYYTARVKVALTDKGYRVLDYFHENFGGHIGSEVERKGNARPFREWRASGPEAKALLEDIFPLLLVKREQARLALELCEMVEDAPLRPNGRHEWSPQMRQRGEILKRRVNELNLRGKDRADRAIPGKGAVAVWRYGTWMKPEEDLFGPVEFDGSLPACGSMRNGVVYAPPTSGHLTDGSECSLSHGGEMLPTPTVSDANGAGSHGDGGADLRTAVTLLPTPRAAEAQQSMSAPAARAHVEAGMGGLTETIGARLLPTPTTRDHKDTNQRDDDSCPPGALNNHVVSDWGPYEAAVRRWERVTGRDTPAPTQLSARGKAQLAPAFVEWMMGLPEGWVTGRGLSRVQELKMLGNGVVHQQAAEAIRRCLHALARC